ncbi:hypothetical protein [Geoglobus acetivorans]|uniref:Uncharacterized protein n=1 Tax=Geoglobus acetivorans TaxID=565033 RepID=A0A0A7GD19_GEOAI|nr:hypothetical protein GACE_0882 [Geoglobus acetivorans]
MSLSELPVPLSYKVIRAGSTETIVLTCPKCGRVGRLTRNGYNSHGPKFRVEHEEGYCPLSFFDGPIYDEVRKIYDSVRVKR